MPLTNSQYDAIIREYNKKQLHTRHILDEHYEEIYERIPQIRQIDDTISSLSVTQAKKLLNGDQNALHELKEEIRRLAAKRKELLISFGYPEHYLEPQYICGVCEDTGYIGNDKCHCFRKEAIEMIYTQSNLQTILEKENFTTFSFDYYSDRFTYPATGQTPLAMAKHAVAICRDFIASFDSSFQNLFFYGDTGVGKTFFSNCIAKELIDSTHSVVYFTAFQLFDLFSQNRFQKDEEARRMYPYIFDCDLLIIDDLGTELTNSFVSSHLFLTVNERILNRRSTIISTNLSLNQLKETYSERTFSRISSCYTMLKLVGDDIRIQKTFHP